MSAPSQSGGAPITDKRQLVDYLAAGCKPPEEWRIGTEHEKFVFRRKDLHPVPYEGADGIRALLEGLRRFGWEPVLDGENMVGLSEAGGGADLAGAGRPVRALGCAARNASSDLRRATDPSAPGARGHRRAGPRHAGARLPAEMAARGLLLDAEAALRGDARLHADARQTRPRHDAPHLHRAGQSRFRIRSRHGAEIRASASRCSRWRSRSSPIRPSSKASPRTISAIAATSGPMSIPTARGMLPFVFENGFGFERYVDYMLDVPMYFVYRDGNYIDVAGQSFRDFLAGKLPGLPGAIADHERLVRSSDHRLSRDPHQALSSRCAAPMAARGATSARCRRFWTGLLYDRASLDAACGLVADWSEEERELSAHRRAAPRTRDAVPRQEARRDGARRARARARRLAAARPARRPGAGREPFLDAALRDRAFGYARRPRSSSTTSPRAGAASVDPVYAEDAITESALPRRRRRGISGPIRGRRSAPTAH